MTRKFAKLIRIDRNNPITRDGSYEFLCQLQSALLLALREQGRLSPMQHRYARELLERQRRDHSVRNRRGP